MGYVPAWLPLAYNEALYFFPWSCSSASHPPLKQPCWCVPQWVSRTVLWLGSETSPRGYLPWHSPSSSGCVCLPEQITAELLVSPRGAFYSCRASHRQSGNLLKDFLIIIILMQFKNTFSIWNFEKKHSTDYIDLL